MKGNKRYVKTVRHMICTNTPLFRSASDNSTLHAYCIECEFNTESDELEYTVKSIEVEEDNVEHELQLVTDEGNKDQLAVPEGENQSNIIQVIR